MIYWNWGTICAYELASTITGYKPNRKFMGWTRKKPEKHIASSLHIDFFGGNVTSVMAKIDLQRMQKVVESMPGRMKAVIKAKGGPIP